LSYDRRILLHNISRCLQQNPSISLAALCRELQLSRRTIQKAVVVASGKTFRDLREEALIARVKNLFISEPSLAIKAISFSLGYESPRSFARAIRRACGFSPQELRAVAAEEFLSRASGCAPGQNDSEPDWFDLRPPQTSHCPFLSRCARRERVACREVLNRVSTGNHVPVPILA
jgi:AraC-like DNA-binding protein